MKRYRVEVHQALEDSLPKTLIVGLSPIELINPSGMIVHKIMDSMLQGDSDVHIISTRILNNSLDNDRGVGGYILILKDGEDQCYLRSYRSIAKVWINPLSDT